MNNLFASVLPASGAISLGAFLLCIAAALVCGVLAALAASFRSRMTRSVTVSVILLAPISSAIILMAQNNLATGLAVLGAVSLVRFRSIPGKARDIVAIFLSLTAGVACANGYVAVALVVVMIICAAMLLLALIPLPEDREYDLRVTVPESLNFTGAFDDLFDEYAASRRLVSVRTSNMGSLYKLHYRVAFRDTAKIREFIDKLRCRNGNLEISVCEGGTSAEEL